MKSLIQACRDVLEDTNALLENYESIGVGSSRLKAMTQKAWKKVAWDEEHIKDLRSRILSNPTLLEAFIAGLARSV